MNEGFAVFLKEWTAALDGCPRKASSEEGHAPVNQSGSKLVLVLPAPQTVALGLPVSRQSLAISRNDNRSPDNSDQFSWSKWLLCRANTVTLHPAEVSPLPKPHPAKTPFPNLKGFSNLELVVLLCRSRTGRQGQASAMP